MERPHITSVSIDIINHHIRTPIKDMDTAFKLSNFLAKHIRNAKTNVDKDNRSRDLNKYVQNREIVQRKTNTIEI